MELVGFSLSDEEIALLKMIQGKIDLDPNDMNKRPEAIRYCLKLLNEVLSIRYDIRGGLKVEDIGFLKKDGRQIVEGDKVIMSGGVVHTVVEVIWSEEGEPYYVVTDPILERRFNINLSDIRFRVVDSFGVW